MQPSQRTHYCLLHRDYYRPLLLEYITTRYTCSWVKEHYCILHRDYYRPLLLEYITTRYTCSRVKEHTLLYITQRLLQAVTLRVYNYTIYVQLSQRTHYCILHRDYYRPLLLEYITTRYTYSWVKEHTLLYITQRLLQAFTLRVYNYTIYVQLSQRTHTTVYYTETTTGLYS